MAYGLTFCFFITFFLSIIPECECYWMHDSFIKISHGWVILHSLYLFILPIIIILVHKQYNIKSLFKPFILHYLISVISMSSLAISVNKPCESINGGHFMFISMYPVLIYYLTNVIVFFFICYMAYKTAFLIKAYKHKQITIK